MLSHRSTIVLVVGFAFALVSCDPASGPVIANGYGVPITLHAEFSEGKPFDGMIPSGTDFWQHFEGRRLVSLSITPVNGTLRTYAASSLDQARLITRVKDELWVVTENGIRLEDLHRLKSVRKTLPRSR